MLEKIPAAVGRALKSVRPGLEKTLFHHQAVGDAPDSLRVESTAFAEGTALPSRFTEDGAKLSPPLRWSGVPGGAQTVVLIVEDADSPTPLPIMHAMVLDLRGSDGMLDEGELKSKGGSGAPHILGKNSFGKAEWLPPDPPTGHGSHRYVFQVFALDRRPSLHDGASKHEVVEALKGHVLAKGLTIATYERPG